MITCALSDKQLRSLRVKVAGDLLDLIKPENKDTFSLKDYLKSIYDAVYSNTNNQNSAIDYARMTGVFIKQIYGRDQRLTPLRQKGYSNDAIDDYTIAASDPKKGFTYVADFLGVNTNPSEDLAEIKNALTIDEHIKAVQNAIVKKNANTVYGETLKPTSAITTSIQELIDGNSAKGQDPRMLFYTKFTKDVLDKVYSSGKQDLAGIPYEGVNGGLHISLVKYTEIAIDDTYPYVKDVLMSGEEKDYIIEDYNNAFVYVITDKDGNIVRFNEDYAVAANGKPVYYNSRYLPQKNTDGSFKVDSVTNTQTPVEIAENLNISLDEARLKLNTEFQMLEAAYNYIRETKGNRITYSIMGGSYGAQVYDNTKPVPFSSMNLGGSTVTFKFLGKDAVFPGSSSGIYMSTDKGSIKYLVYGPTLSEDVVNNLVTLLTEDVVDKSGNPIPNDVKVKLMGTYLLNSIKDLAYGVDKNTGELFIRYQGEKIKLGDKAVAKEKLTEAFSKNAQGFGRLYPINTDKANSNEKVTLFSVKPGTNPVVTTEQVGYMDYLKSFASVMANLGIDGTPAQYNPYLALAPVMAQALKIIAPETLPKTPLTNEQRVAQLRAAEQLELRNAIPDIDSYKDAEGNIDKSKLSGIKLGIYNQIYAKYDTLITPWLGSKSKNVRPNVEVISENYTPELLRANPDKLFLFGDNNTRSGKGGQAIIRDEPNAMGISTKKLPSNAAEAFMSDTELASNKATINSDIYKAIQKAAKEGKTIVLPKGGFGTGLAALATKAPLTFAYLNKRLQEEFGFNNTTGELAALEGAAKEVDVPVKTVSEAYGVVTAETNPSETTTRRFVSLVQPQILAQAYQENVTGNKMFMYGLRWTRKNKAKAPLTNKSYANKGLATTDSKAKDGYVYDTVDQNGNPLAPISDLQPIIKEIEKTLGIDMSNYDAVIGNIYLPGQRIQTHRDTTESLSARNYPVVVYTLGAGNAINVYEDTKNPGSISFASSKKITIPTKNGTIYTFGMGGKGRFELAHDTPSAIAKGETLDPITMPNGDVIKDYTITLTFRRAADLEPGMATSPGVTTTQPDAPAPIQEIKAEAINEATTQMFQRRGRTSADDTTLDNFLNNKDFLNRYKNKLDKQTNIEATKEQIRLAKVWYAKSPLAKHIKLNIMFNAINTATPNGVARWDVNGITLFKGSDFSDLYHESWHGFTQMFLSAEERADLYNEARKASGKFKSFDGKIVEFSTATDEQLEEYLAEDFREYMLSNGKKVLDKTPVKKSIFQKILDVLRYLFTGIRYQDGVTNGMNNPKIQELYNKLRVGDLSQYTFNQENAQFPGGLNKTKMDSIDPSNPRFLPQISADASRLISTTVDALFSEAIDYLNRGNNTKAYTTAVIKTDEGRKIGYKYAESALTTSLYNALLDRNDMVQQGVDTADIDKEIDTLSWALANFGDTNDLSNPQGVIKFHMENSGLLEFEDRTTEVKDDSKLYQKNEFEAKAGNETAQKSLASPNLIYTLRSLSDYNKDKTPKLNALGYPKLMDFNRAWNRMMNITEGAKDIDDIYNKLSAASEDYPVVAQFLSKIGAPSNMERSSQELWTEITKIFTMKRIPLVELHAEVIQSLDPATNKSTTDISFTPSRAGGEYRKVGTKWDNLFAVMQPNKYIVVNNNNVNTLNIRAVLEDFPAVDSKNVFGFMEAIGMPFEDNPTVLKALENTENGAMKAIKDIHRTIQYGIYKYNNGPGLSTPIVITRPSQLFAQYKVNTKDSRLNITLGGESKKFTAIQKFHLAWSDDFSDTTVSNAEGENQYEKSMRSTVINMIDAINMAATETALTQEGVEAADDLSMNHLAKSRNPFMKTSFFMRSIFDENGNKRVYTNEYGDRIEAGIELLNMSGASLTKQNVKGIIDESGVASSNADETTKLLEDFYMMMLYGVSEATRHADKSTTYLYRLIQANPKAKHLIKLSSFTENLDADNRVISDGKYTFIQMLTGYLASEYERIQKVKEDEVAGNATVGKSTYSKEGAEFVVFDKILKGTTKEALKKFRSSSLAEPVITAEQFLKKLETSKLRDTVEKEIGDYLTAQTKEFTGRLNELNFFNNNNLTNPVIKGMLRDKEYFNSLTGDRKKEISESIAEAYVANSWVQNYETVMMFYGDPGLYNHAKDEFFKRNAGVGATGTIPRTDLYMQDYINSRLSGLSYSNTKYGLSPKRFGKTMTSAVLTDPITESIYADEYIKAAKAWEKERLKKIGASAKEIKEALSRVEELFTPYKEMTEGDGQGWINFDAYRALLISLNKWSPYQEELYAKIVNGEDVSTEDVYQFFPVKKMQYWGPLKTDGLPVYAFHKYSLMPLIPNVIQGKNLEGLQKKMLEKGIDYALLQSGSKINTLTKDGKADKFYNDSTSNTDKTVAYTAEDYDFTPNEIFLNYFKDQLEVHDHYSDKVTFSTQLRKLIEDGLMENGVPVDWRTNITDPAARIDAWESASATEKDESDNYKKLIKYESLLNRLVELKKDKLRQEVGTNLNQLMLFVKKELNRQELAEHELDFVNDAGDLKYSVELSLSADKIEKMLVAVVQKRLINQKINGEALVQVSGVGFEDANKNMRNATKKEIKKYGTNGLTFYTQKEDGTTAAMKIKVAMQGSFKNLLELPEVKALVSSTVTPLDALNSLIKDEAWLSTGDNRQMVTMLAARIPVQGLNSMEFMEVFEFLPENAGNIVILPAEIVAKSGGDFDIDKMYTLMPNIKRQTSEISKQAIEDISEILGKKIGKKDIQNAINIRENEFQLTEEDQKILDYVDNFSTEEVKIGLVKGDNVKAIENDLIMSSVEILSMQSNFTSLITPNSTDIVKPVSKFMAKTMRGESGMVSPTEIFEIGRNLYKHQSNSIGKAVLGIIAVNNTFNTLFSRTGLIMDQFRILTETDEGTTYMRQELKLPHNSINGKISLSSLYSNEKLGTKISDVINQMINGAVDVAKDAWIFDIQGNKEVIPSLLFMIQAGVPVRQAIYFVSQPMIQEYVKAQRLLKSQFAQPIGLADPGLFYRIHARDTIVTNPENGFTDDITSLYNKKSRVDKTKVFDLFANWANIGERADLFTEANLEANLTKKGEYTDTDRAAFAHFLQIQEMAGQVTQLTMALKFDNDKTTTLFDARAKLAKIGELANGISPESIRRISEESPIAAFKIQDFILELYSDLFPLRDNPAVVQAIEKLYMKNDDGVTPIMSVKKELGMDDEQFQRTFRNDFIHYLFQNDYYKFDRNTKTYGGLNIEVNEVESLFAAARMKEGKLYVNKKQIETLYQSKAFSRNTAWSHRMAPVPSYVFDMYDTVETKSIGLDLFTKFMYEREVIRTFAENSVENIAKTDEFKYYYETFKSEQSDEARRYKAHESVLRDKALGNLNIPGYMFFGDNAYGRQVMQLKAKYPQLFDTYAVLNNLESFTKNYGTSSMTNLKFSNTLYTADDLNIYHENLLDLMNPSVKKVEDAVENRRISELLQKLPIFAMLQSGGDTKSTYSLVRAMPPSVTVPLLENPVNEFLELSNKEKNERLDKYLTKFKKQYNKSNYLKSKLKDFLTGDAKPAATDAGKRIINLQEIEEIVNAADDSQSEDVSARTISINGVDINLDELGIGFQPNGQQIEALDKIAKFLSEPYDPGVEPIDNMYTLMGYAGTGKTSITRILLKYLDTTDKTVGITATTHVAKGVIREAVGKSVSTIHKALNLRPNIDLTKPIDLSKLDMVQGDVDGMEAPDILVIDESSFIGESLFNYIKKYADAQNIKVLFIGDPGQIKPVEENKNGEEVLAKKNSPVFEAVGNFSELTQVERQATGNPLGPILDAIRSNSKSSAEVFAHESNISGNEGIAFTDSSKEFMKNLIAAFQSENFKKNRKFVRALTYINESIPGKNAASVTSLNRAIRKGLGFSQEYTAGEILKGYDNFNQKKDGNYVINNSAEYVILESEYISEKELGKDLPKIGIPSVIVSGYKVTVEDLSNPGVKETIFIVDKSNDDSIFIQLAETVEAIQTKARAQGNGVWVNYYYPFIKSFISSQPGKIGGRTVVKKGIDYGYAHTIHKSQGATYTNVFVDYGSINISSDIEERNQMRYVALSRATNIAYTYSGATVGTPPAIDWESSFGEQKVIAGRTDEVKLSAKTEADILTLDRVGIYEDAKTGIRTFRYTKEKGVPAKGVLTEDTAKLFAIDYPDAVPVYNETANLDPNIAGTNTVWRDTGLGIGIPTKKNARPTKSDSVELNAKDALTDETLEDNKKAIDAVIAQLLNEKGKGKELIFDANGYGQYMIGYNETTGQRLNGDPVALETFLHLSEQLFSNFGYINPHYLDYVQGRRTVQKAAPVTDDEILEEIKKCFPKK